MKGNKNLGIMVTLLACFAISSTASFAADGFGTPGPSAQRQAALDAYNQRPLSFEPNEGQTDARVRFFSRGPGYNVFLTATDAVLSLQEQAADLDTEITPGRSKKPHMTSTSAVRMSLLGANPNPRVVPIEKLPGKSNYMVGNDRSKWRINIPTFAQVRYQDVYPGVDLVYYGNQRELEYDFVLSKGADPSRIRLSFAGAKALRVDRQSGDLLITTPAGSELRHVRPRVFQQAGNTRVEVAGSYQLITGNEVAFKLAGFDRQHELVIDPTISFTAFLAGSNQDEARAVAVDASGNAYVTGDTASTNLPLVSAWQQSFGSVFLTKLSPTGVILFSTYWGWNDVANGIAVDSTGVYIFPASG
jgi:hypothetical protein